MLKSIVLWTPFNGIELNKTRIGRVVKSLIRVDIANHRFKKHSLVFKWPELLNACSMAIWWVVSDGCPEIAARFEVLLSGIPARMKGAFHRTETYKLISSFQTGRRGIWKRIRKQSSKEELEEEHSQSTVGLNAISNLIIFVSSFRLNRPLGSIKYWWPSLECPVVAQCIGQLDGRAISGKFLGELLGELLMAPSLISMVAVRLD